MCEDTTHLLVRRSANVLDRNAPFFGLQHNVGAVAHGSSLVGLCTGVACQAQVKRTGFKVANTQRGGRETFGRSA